MSDRFRSIYGRGLVGELKHIVHHPYLVVTMADLWPLFDREFDDGLVGPMFVTTLDRHELEEQIDALPRFEAVIGLGGGQAIDVAKYVTWRRRVPLFQLPTAMSVDAPFGERAGVRENGIVRYVGFAVPEAVYVDFDVIRSAPAGLNRSGAGDILCYHTGVWDWRMADEVGKGEPKWPYDERLARESLTVLESVISAADEIHDVTDSGIRTQMEANRYGGAAFHNAGWNPRLEEGSEHHFFYCLEYQTGRKFVHGQPVTLGVLLMSALQENRADEMKAVADRIGVPYHPEQMGVTWDEVASALRSLPAFVLDAGLFATVATERPITEDYIARMRDWLA
jgi:glycerol dehydrogenase-like iron-containing ADH family enzyme